MLLPTEQLLWTKSRIPCWSRVSSLNCQNIWRECGKFPTQNEFTFYICITWMYPDTIFIVVDKTYEKDISN
jgi:hypothetical protein